MKTRKIIHIDMDCFFAAVEIKHTPDLLRKPVAVGGKAEKRGVIAAASYEARKYGVHSAMPTAQAFKLCPHLILLHPRFSLYKEESLEVFKIFKTYTDKIEPLSLDEAFLDVTSYDLPKGSATLLALEIRKRILMERGLTASAGIAHNKFLAKVASDIKKPNGQFTVSPEESFNFASQLPVEKIFGVGKKTAQKMHTLGIYTCTDLQKIPLFELQRTFGKFGDTLYKLCRGDDEREVKNSRTRKSFGVETTFAKDLSTKQDILDKAFTLFLDFEKRFLSSKHSERDIKTLSIKVKTYDFNLKTKDIGISAKPTFEDFSSNLSSLWEEELYHKPLRLIGLSVRFKENNSDSHQQLNLPL